MKHLIISDIFGLTKPLLSFAQQLDNAEVIDPYNGLATGFKSESEAYHYFIEHCGHDQYLHRVNECFRTAKKPESVIGFSAGATALWRYIAQPDAPTFKQVTGFYSGQIRHYLSLAPRQPIKLIFPVKEQHFDVNEVITQLAKNRQITIEQCDFHHGFMNPCSAHFNQQGYAHYLQQLKQLN
ncbi:hypothetical protein [Thalassotalea ganghwensis]